MFTLDNLLCSAHSTNFIDMMIKTNLMLLFHGKMSENILSKMWADYWQHEGTELWNYLGSHFLTPSWDLVETFQRPWCDIEETLLKDLVIVLEYWILMFHTWKKIWESLISCVLQKLRHLSSRVIFSPSNDLCSWEFYWLQLIF